MKIIKCYLLLILLLFSGAILAQSDLKNPPLNTEIDLLNPKEKKEYKSFERSYNEESIRLRRVNDTLSIYLEGQKKLAITALDITAFEDFEGFEKDVIPFLELLDQLNLDFEKKSYQIRFSPRSNEIQIKERDEFRFKSFEGIVLPVFRHEIIFTYQVEMLEINLFLGEIDELLVFKDGGISDMIRAEAVANLWFEKYDKKVFNKDLRIDKEGNKQVVTFANMERSSAISFGLDVGVKMLAGQFPFNFELAAVYRPQKLNKWTQWENGFFFSLDMNQFVTRSEEGKYQLSQGSFVNVGFVTGPKSNAIRLYYGRLVSDTGEKIFQFNKNKVGMDLLATKNLRISYEYFIGSDDSDWINSIGISFPIVSAR